MSPTLACVVFGLNWKPGCRKYCQMQNTSFFFLVKTNVSNFDGVGGWSVASLRLGRFRCRRGGRVVGPDASCKGSSCQHHIPQHSVFEEASKTQKLGSSSEAMGIQE